MRFTHIFTIISAAVATIAAPVDAPEKRDDASILDQATAVLHQLNADLADQVGALNKASGSAKIFQPFGYNVAVSLSTAFGKAINGINGLPDLPSKENKPEYVVKHFAPLVDNTSEITFSYIKRLVYESRQLFNSPQYNYYETQMDNGLHMLVLAIDNKFAGYSCALAKAVGINTVPGQALAQVSTHTFAILFDAVNVGQCS